jgi:hypothetical protein
VILVSHAPDLVSALQREDGSRQVLLEKHLSETIVKDGEVPSWNWPSR